MIFEYYSCKPSQGGGNPAKATLLLALVFLLGCETSDNLTIGTAKSKKAENNVEAINYFVNMGDALKRMILEANHSSIGTVTLQETRGSADNMLKLQERELDLGLSALYSYGKEGDGENSKIVLPLFDYYLHLVVSKSLADKCDTKHESDRDLDLKSLWDCAQELTGDDHHLSVNIGGPGSGLRLKAEEVVASLQEIGEETLEKANSRNNRADLLGKNDRCENDVAGEFLSTANKQLMNNCVDAIFISAPIPDKRIEALLAAGHVLYKIDPSAFTDALCETPQERNNGAFLNSLCDRRNAAKEKGVSPNPFAGSIPAYTYSKQSLPIETVRDPSMLVARTDVPKDKIKAVLRVIFDKASYLRDVHPSTASIWTYFDANNRSRIATVADYHEGVEEFFTGIEAELLIASGPVEGIHYQRAKDLQGILSRYGVSSFVVPTRGSIENLYLLNEEDRKTIAFVDYHAALASYLPDSISVFNSTRPHHSLRIPESLPTRDSDGSVGKAIVVDSWGIPKHVEFTRLGSLYPQLLLPIVRDNYPLLALDCCDDDIKNTSGEGEQENQSDLLNLRISFGDPQSGTQALARAVMTKAISETFNVSSAEFISTEATSKRLWGQSCYDNDHVGPCRDAEEEYRQDGQIDIAFIVSHQNSGLVNQLLREKNVEPIGLSGHLIRNFVSSPALQRRILSLPDVGEIDTLETTAILLANSAVTSKQAEKITRAVHENSAQFIEQTTVSGGFSNTDKRLVDFSSPIPLHPRAEAYFREVGILPSDSPFIDWGAVLRLIGSALALIAVLLRPVARYFGITKMEKRVANVQLKSGTDDAVFQLRQLEDEAKASMNRRVFRDTLRFRGWPISTGAWRSLEGLISQRIDTARHFLTRNLAWELTESIGSDDTDQAAWRRDFSRRIANYFHRGEINIGQYEFLRRLLNGEEAYQPYANSRIADAQESPDVESTPG